MFFFKLLAQYSTVIPTAHICFVVAAAVAVIFIVYHSQRYIFKTSQHFECNSLLIVFARFLTDKLCKSSVVFNWFNFLTVY